MTLRIASMAACALFAAPALAQTDEPEGDGQIDLESVDSLLGGSAVTEPEDEDAGDAAEEAGVADGDIAVDEAADEESTDDEDADEATTDEDGEISDLTRAFNGYSLCASDAGTELEEQGFAIDQIGTEALLRCAGQRAAYVNAFYFDLLPRYPESTEQQVREVADRLVTQSDAALMNVVSAEVRELRDARPEEGAEDVEAQ
ncbi:MAG: hypothetical protein HKN78_05660 [Sphingomonadaceae bacterium]|nr:hypothetical protein [Sphingomonadaceae bacterium]